MKTTSVSEHGTTTGNRQLIVEGVTDKAGIAGVRAAVWSNRSGGADLKWYLLEPYGDNWRAIIKVADYDFETGDYQVHIYGTDGYGNDGMMGAVAFYIAPTQYTYNEFSVNYYTSMFFTKLKGLEGPYGIRNVQFYVHPVYYNDVPSVLYDATHSSYANTWSADGYFSDFKFIRSRYSFNIVITDKRGDVDYLMDAFYVDMY